jgi:transposase-like protein
MLKQIVKWLEDRKIFLRDRTPNVVRALGMLLYYAGLSYEKAGKLLGVSYEAVREWYQKGKVLFEETVEKKVRTRIAVDEKEITINGTTKLYIWAAVDLDDEKVIATLVTYGRSSLEAMAFLRRVKRVCKGKLPRVFVDGGSWYPWALQRLGFQRYTVIRFGPRSAIERFFADLTKRITVFWNKFKGTFTRYSIQNWVIAYAGFRNYSKDSKEVLS